VLLDPRVVAVVSGAARRYILQR